MASAEKKNHSFRDFKGVNTQADRKMIANDEFAWLENVMPIGHGNAKTIPGPSAALSTLPGNEICYYMAPGNINNVDYMFMFCTSGSLYSVNISITPNYTPVQVAVAGTFSATAARLCQWKNERILIIDPNKGFFDYDGTTLTVYKNTVGSVVATIPGINFTSNPAISVSGGGGSGASFTSKIGVNTAVLGAAGSGYAIGDLLSVTGGTSTVVATLTVLTLGASQAVATFSISNQGSYTSTAGVASPAATTGGHGTGFTATVNFGVVSVTVTNPGANYTSAPTLTTSGGGGTGTVLTPSMNTNASGTSIASYAGRVWIATGTYPVIRTILFTGPGSYNDFSTVNLGGSFIMTDETLKGSVAKLYAANNFLYIIGANSVNILSNVVVTTPIYDVNSKILVAATTTFSNTNLVASVGTELDNSVIAYYRSISFFTDYGIMGLSGATPEKISDDLDGVFPYLDFSQQVSGGVAVIFNIICLCYLVKYNDPLTGTARQLLLIHVGKKWFFATQGSGINFVASAAQDPDVPDLWGTDGRSLYKMFADVNAGLSQIVRTKLWDMGDSLITKQAYKFGLETIAPKTTASFNISIETETKTQSYAALSATVMTWYNNSNIPIVWKNNLSQVITWLATGYVFFRQDVNNVGNYIGVTVTSSSPGVTYSGIHLQYELRTPWAGAPF